MDDFKPPSNSNSPHGATADARFLHFCKNGLALNDNTLAEALKLFDETNHLLLPTSNSALGSGSPEEAELYWFAFVLYSLKRLGNRNSNDNANENQNDFSLCQIMRVAKLNIIDFFKELPQFIVKVGPILSNRFGADWETRLQAKESHANFVQLSHLSKLEELNFKRPALIPLVHEFYKSCIPFYEQKALLSQNINQISIEQLERFLLSQNVNLGYYKRVYEELFSTNDEKIDLAITASPGYVSNYYRFGWLLFLALRVHAFSNFKDLVTCTNGLVSILAILIIHLPVRFRKFSIDDPSQFVTRGSKGVDLLASLCKKYETSEDELRQTMEKANNLIADILKKKAYPASECRNETLDCIDTDGLTYFEDLLDEVSLSSNLSILEKDYNKAICNNGEFDERVFIDQKDSLLCSSSLSDSVINIAGTKRKFDLLASPTKTITSPLSPFRSPSASRMTDSLAGISSKMIATPVSTAMTTAKWLRTIISPLPSRPSADLEQFFSACDRNVTTDVIRRAHIMLEAIFPSSGDRSITAGLQSTNLMDSIWAEQRRLEALKLYYRVLQAMCRAEAQILHGSNLTTLLTNERFHRCMLACSAELVLATHKSVTVLFPAVLERTGITAFDLSKVIESFVRHEESLPRELRRHLNSLEERLLESMVWEKGSSMYNSLTVARPALSVEINCLGLLAEPMPSLDAIALEINLSSGSLPPVPSLQKLENNTSQIGDIQSPKRACSEYRSVLVERNSFTSPVKDRLLALNNLKSKLLPPVPLQSAFASPTRPNPGGRGETCAETAINVFFGKILKLAAVRINGMIEKLHLSQQIRERVYCLFQHILNQRTALFFNRHIDQIILSCFYGVAKISQLNLTFREIIYNYRMQPHCKPQVFRSIFVGWSAVRRTGKIGQDHVDIITFYNEVFIPSVKPLLVELAPSGVAQSPSKVLESSNKNESPCPGSPKVSPFPNLPDMSPKKVSPAHNVYVSPLRSSKMDALISHSSKSYYACVGESTHAYQSPSKDLTAINSRLNSSRKLRGQLNFDNADVGLVSDSLVANSLYLQNGSRPSEPVKSEQADT